MLTKSIDTKFKSKLFWLLLPISILAVFVIINGGLSANNDKNLEREVIQVDSLFRNSRQISAEHIEVDSLSHPLAQISQDGSSANIVLQTYERAYTVSILAPEESVFVASYLYQYTSMEDASSAAQYLQDIVQQDGNGVLMNEVSGSDIAWQGHTYELFGSDGDAIFWFIGSKNDVLYLMMVNGLEREIAKDSFERVMHTFADN